MWFHLVLLLEVPGCLTQRVNCGRQCLQKEGEWGDSEILSLKTLCILYPSILFLDQAAAMLAILLFVLACMQSGAPESEAASDDSTRIPAASNASTAPSNVSIRAPAASNASIRAPAASNISASASSGCTDRRVRFARRCRTVFVT